MKSHYFVNLTTSHYLCLILLVGNNSRGPVYPKEGVITQGWDTRKQGSQGAITEVCQPQGTCKDRRHKPAQGGGKYFSIFFSIKIYLFIYLFGCGGSSLLDVGFA